MTRGAVVQPNGLHAAASSRALGLAGPVLHSAVVVLSRRSQSYLRLLRPQSVESAVGSFQGSLQVLKLSHVRI